MAGDAIIGALRIILGADTAEFETGLKKASGGLSTFAKTAGAVAAGGLLEKVITKTIELLGDLVMATFKSIDAMDKMGKEAQKLGIPVEELSKLSVVAKLADVEMAELSKSVVQLSKRLVEGADTATDPARRAITALGLSYKQLVALSPDKQMELLANRFSQFRDGADKTAAAVALFGKAGANLIPLLNEGADGFRKASEMAAKLGLVMSKEASESAQKFQDNMKLVGLALTQGVFNVIAEKLLPIFVLFSEGLLNLTVTFMGLIGAGDKVAKIMEELKKKMNMPTDEAARNAENFRNKINDLRIQALELHGTFRNSLPEGFIATAVSLKLAKADMFTLGEGVIKLTKDMQLLRMEMINIEAAKLTQEFLTPWQQYELQLAKINRALGAEFPISAQTAALAGASAADKLRNSYITATAGIAGAFGEMFTAIGGEQSAWAKAAKIAAAAQALINTLQGATMALAQGGIYGFAAAAAITAKGMALVAAIKGTPIGFASGGSFKIGGVGGIDSKMVTMRASPGEMVDVRKTSYGESVTGDSSKVTTVPLMLQGSNFHISSLRDLVEKLNEGISDGYRIVLAPT